MNPIKNFLHWLKESLSPMPDLANRYYGLKGHSQQEYKLDHVRSHLELSIDNPLLAIRDLLFHDIEKHVIELLIHDKIMTFLGDKDLSLKELLDVHDPIFKEVYAELPVHKKDVFISLSKTLLLDALIDERMHNDDILALRHDNFSLLSLLSSIDSVSMLFTTLREALEYSAPSRIRKLYGIFEYGIHTLPVIDWEVAEQFTDRRPIDTNKVIDSLLLLAKIYKLSLMTQIPESKPIYLANRILIKLEDFAEKEQNMFVESLLYSLDTEHAGNLLDFLHQIPVSLSKKVLNMRRERKQKSQQLIEGSKALVDVAISTGRIDLLAKYNLFSEKYFRRSDIPSMIDRFSLEHYVHQNEDGSYSYVTSEIINVGRVFSYFMTNPEMSTQAVRSAFDNNYKRMYEMIVIGERPSSFIDVLTKNASASFREKIRNDIRDFRIHYSKVNDDGKVRQINRVG